MLVELKPLKAMLLCSLLLLPGCSGSLKPLSPTQQVRIPPPSAELMEGVEKPSKDYWQRVQNWLEKAVKELESFQPKPPACKGTSTECA